MAKAAKPRGLEAKLARLRALAGEESIPGHVAELRDALRDKSNFAVAAAAEIVGARALGDLVPDLVAAFQLFTIDGVKTDKTCRAKIAIIEALNKLECDDESFFLTALRYRQPEPAWGRSEDTAAPVRGEAAYALVRLRRRGVELLLLDLLLESEKLARSAAVRALGACASVAAIALLRFKARVGDDEPEVTCECLTALMSAEPKESTAFVGTFLDAADDIVAEGAALALGESRSFEAFERLKAQLARISKESLRNVVLLAIAITRQPAAVEFLLGVLRADDSMTAAGALAALAIHRHNPAVRDRIAVLVAKSSDKALAAELAKWD